MEGDEEKEVKVIKERGESRKVYVNDLWTGPYLSVYSVSGTRLECKLSP